DEELATILAHFLRKQPLICPYLYANERSTENWTRQLNSELEKCGAFIYLCGAELGETQEREVLWHIHHGKSQNQKTLYAVLPGGKIAEHLKLPGQVDPIFCHETDDVPSYLAREISRRLTGKWVPNDGVPLGYLFEHEKAIIKAYPEGKLKLPD